MNPIIEMGDSGCDFNVSVGTKLSFTYHEHVSVGFTAEYEIEDNHVISMVESETKYAYPERMKEPGITGADSAETTFIFKAIALGTSLVVIRKFFRYELEKEISFRITVS